jgi:hypothetical protein
LVGDYNTLSSWALLKNLTVETTWPNRILLNVTSTAAQVEQAFYVNLNYRLRPDGTQFYALDRDPSLDLPLTVAYVGNLDNFYVPKMAEVPVCNSVFNVNSNDLRAAYAPGGCPSTTAPKGLTGAGECVGIYAPGDVDDHDLTAYAADIQETGFKLSQVTRIPPQPPGYVSHYNGEATLARRGNGHLHGPRSRYCSVYG